MRSKFLVVCLSFLAVTLPVHADTVTNYVINFTTTYGSPAPVSGSFTYNSTKPTFSNFVVLWDGVSIDLTASANAPIVQAGGTGCAGESSTPSYGFALISHTVSGCSPYTYWEGTTTSSPYYTFFDFFTQTGTGSNQIYTYSNPVSGPAGLVYGTWTIESVSTPEPLSTPEPSTFLLLTLGTLSLMGVRRPPRDSR
jgi:hypothetical protein